MDKLKFKSTIKCGGCINTVTPELDKLEAIHQWEVDLQHPDRILTVEGDNLNPNSIVQTLAAVGYKAELISE